MLARGFVLQTYFKKGETSNEKFSNDRVVHRGESERKILRGFS